MVMSVTGLTLVIAPYLLYVITMIVNLITALTSNAHLWALQYGAVSLRNGRNAH
jgi:hypothetical protein